MCLVVFAVDSHPEYKLVLAANRDEYLRRPTAEAHFWEDAPEVLAGRDLAAGGTWLGVTKGGRIAAVTNFRDPSWRVPNPLSRGKLVADYLCGDRSKGEYLMYLEGVGPRCNGFNIIFGDTESLHFFSNRGGTPGRIPAGVQGLSNHLLNTPWPKVTYAKEGLARLLSGEKINPQMLFSLMETHFPFPLEQLPDTGIGIERETMLSSVCIRGADYGTRSTTLLFVDRHHTMTFIERTHSTGATNTFVISPGERG